MTRGSRSHSRTIASPKTCVYCGGAGEEGRDGAGPALRDRLRLGGMPLLHALQAAVLGGREALALDRGAVDDDGPLGLEGGAQRAAHGAHVVAVDHAEVRPVELLPPQAGRPEGLHGLLEARAEALERRADAGRQLRELLLDALARLPQPRVQPDAVHVARQGADVGRDRHPVVVEDHDDRRAEAAGLGDGLEGHAAGHRAVADDRDDLAVLGAPAQHRLLDADGVADRRRGVARRP